MNVRRWVRWGVLWVLVSACEEGNGALPGTIDAATDSGDAAGSDAGTSGSSAGSMGSDDGGSDTDPSTSGATGTSSGGSDTAGLDEVEAACEADCEAMFATQCSPVNQNVLTCKLQCAAVTVQLGGFCLPEYTAVVQCRADGGYDCVNDFPTPRSTCAAEQVTYTECAADIGCKRFCDAAVESGCGGASFDACLDGCLAEKAALPEFCGFYFDGLPLCEAQSGIECVDGQPTTLGDCSYAVSNIADCIADESDDLCQGYCYLADELACGTGCTADCNSRITDTMCGQQFSNLIDCELRHGDFECSGDRLIGIDICESENSSYEMCLAGG